MKGAKGTPMPSTHFSLYCDKHGIDQTTRKQIRRDLRSQGLEEPYDPKDKRVKATVEKHRTK
jgi:hypothetical protein